MLNAWGRFLSSSDSTYVLNDDPRRGWFGADAQKAMPNFDKEFKCDPSQPHHGFKSWDDFFTREFRPGSAPGRKPDDDAVIVNACESAPYRIARHVKQRDKFWIKSQPYSIAHMLANDSPGTAVCRRNGLPGLPEPAQLSPLAQPGERHGDEGLREGRDILFGGAVGGLRSGRSE